MINRMGLSPAYTRRRMEMILIISSMVVGLVILTAGMFSGEEGAASGLESPEVTAQASAMPGQGWAPLMVYYSAFGSHAQDAQIVRYEWDLDGNGQFDYDATAQGGYANYLYSKPGDYTITLQVTDDQGRFSSDSIQVSVRHPASSSVDYWTVFDDTRVRSIDILLQQADWDEMWADPEAKYQAMADAIIFDERMENVGFSMRGQFSMRVSGEKKPWKIDLDAFIDGQEYRNLRQLLLINNIGDPSMLREKLAYEMLAFAGLPASHVAFVELWIDIIDDDEPINYWGVYTLVERVDNKYLSNRFGRDSKGGNLYKASHAQRGPMDLIYYGENITDYPTQNGSYAYGKMNNIEENDYSDIVALCRIVDGTQYANEDELVQALESAINVDSFLRYLAVITILDNWDAYPNTGNNYYLFNNLLSKRYEWIPWDMAWGENAQASLFPTSGSELIQRAPLLDQVFGVEGYRSQYLAYVDLLLRYWFNTENISEQAERYYDLIAPYWIKATGDKAFFGNQPMFPIEVSENSWVSLVNFASNRNQFLREALATEMQP
ncbi:MAG: CotH kinase family protein [Anaerolineaceae bacterium]|nr:CotH kinase family protein [Anaerolineaceae bacterium]